MGTALTRDLSIVIERVNTTVSYLARSLSQLSRVVSKRLYLGCLGPTWQLLAAEIYTESW